MGIRRLEIDGFRSLKDVIWEPGPLNVLIGANGSGKSNLLRALMLLKAAADGELVETVLQAGGMSSLSWDGQLKPIRLRVLSELSYDNKPAFLSYEFEMQGYGQGALFTISNESLSSGTEFEPEAQPIFSRDYRSVAAQANGKPVILDAPLFYESETILFQGLTERRIPPEVGPSPKFSSAVQSLGAQLAWSLLRQLLSGLRVFHDLRVDAEAQIRRAVVTRLERQVGADGSNLVAVLHTLYSNERGFREKLDQGMHAAFGNEFEELIFPPAEDGRIQLRLRWRSLKRAQSAADLSDGTLRFLFLIAVLANPTPPSLIAIDEPETGLHPSMLPIIAEYAVEASKRTQVILTTHSPQFLNAFSEHPAITTVAELHEGKTVLRRLPVDKLAKWLEHYQLGELMMSGELETME